ncbi:MAG: PDGLE domain-containing protein [Pelosinus sp.]|nr:PDGLE domain-containing protein [Pelosinus sp.]
MYKRFWLALLALALLSPLGLIADGTAWGEWDGKELQSSLGFVPEGIEHFSQWQQALFPDYTVSIGRMALSQAAGYVFSAVVGSVLIYAISMLITKFMLRHKNKTVINE